MFLGAGFSLVYMPTSPGASCTLKFKMAEDTGNSYNLVTENDINVISAAAAMFSGTGNPLPRVSTLYDFGKHRNAQTGSSNTSETETDIDAISRANTMFWGIPRSAALESTASDFRKQRHVRTSGFGYCFYFRFVPVIVGVPYKTYPQPLRSP